MTAEFVEVMVDLPVRQLDRPFTYRVPESMRHQIRQGAKVRVPFGSREVEGYVVGYASPPGVGEPKEVAVLLESYPPDAGAVEMARWLAERYACTFAEAMRAVWPAPLGKGKSTRAPAAKPLEATGSRGLQPTREQADVLELIGRGIRSAEHSVLLLHGVTGSGKTEVYMRAVEHALGISRQAVVLVPEIALTPQMLREVRARFGERAAVLHSRLSPGEKRHEWKRLREGRATVAVGPRSAVFAPLRDVGLIVVDEEHETSYKSGEAPRYDAREVAIARTRLSGGVALFGSATPSLESYYHALQGTYGLLELRDRAERKLLPVATVVDMRGQKGIFSKRLADAIRGRLARGEQAILFINRKGYAPFLMCTECGAVLKCKSCAVSLTYYAGDLSMRCGYCGYRRKAPERCPGCGSPYFKAHGVGTERVEHEVRKLFPRVRVLRMDSDTTTRKGSHERILDAFARGEGDVLVGTQMIAKGLDLPRVTLVGVVNADVSLNLPDFRSAERTFQLLVQVAGRAGRGMLPGEAVIQTYNPGHYSINMAAAHDYRGFYRSEIRAREELGYPPFSHLVSITCSSSSERTAREGAGALAGALGAMAAAEGLDTSVQVMGPAPAPVRRLRGRYRWRVVLKAAELPPVLPLLKRAISECESRRRVPDLRLMLDVDPVNML